MNKLKHNPFEIYSEKKLSIIGISILVFASLLAYLLKARFDGIIDVHFTNAPTLFNPLIDNVSNTILLTLFLFILGYFLNPKTRIWDVFNVAVIARIPFYILPLFNIGGFMSETNDKLLQSIDISTGVLNESISSGTLIIILFFALIGILALCLFGYLLFIGFKTATNSKSIKSIVLLVITVLLCEWVSKIVIHYIN